MSGPGIPGQGEGPAEAAPPAATRVSSPALPAVPARPTAPRPWLQRLAAAELWLTLPALPVLILREVFPPGAPGLALAWLAGLWVLRRTASGRWTRPTVLDAPMLALLATLPGAIYVAGDRAAAFSRAQSLLAAMALAVALANSLRRPREAWRLAGLLLAGGLALVGIGLVGVDWLPKFAPLAWVTDRLPRLIHAVPHATLPIWGVAEQTQIHPNSVAALLILFLPLALGCLAATLGAPGGPADHAPPTWLRPLALAVLLGGGTLLLLTQSRGAWLALLLALALMFQRRRRGIWWALGGGTALAILLLVALGSQRLTTLLPAGSAGGRLKLWRESAALLADAPLTGIGLNNFVIVHGRRPEYQGQFVYQGFPHAHNLLLQTALDYGLPGLVAIVGLMVALAWAAWRTRQRLAGSPLSGLALGLAFGLLAHALHGAVDAICIGSKAGIVPWAFAGSLAGLRAAAGRWAREEDASAAGPQPHPAGPDVQ